MSTKYVICETTAAITTHIRRVDALTPIALGGHVYDRGAVLTLCGQRAAWDSRLPLASAGCRGCRFAFVQAEGDLSWANE